MNTETVNHRYVTLDEVASYTGMSKKFIVKYRTTGRFPGCIRMGSDFRYDLVAIQKQLDTGILLLDTQN